MGLLIDHGAGAGRRGFAEEIVERQYRDVPGLAEIYGPEGRAKCVEDTICTLLYLEAATAAGSPELFVEYVGWVKIIFARFGVREEDLIGNLTAISRELAENAPERPILAEALARLANLPSEAPDAFTESSALRPMAEEYLRLLLEGQRSEAAMVVTEAVAEGTSVAHIYLEVFQPCLREIGRLWQLNRLSTAHEHYFTAATQMIMSGLYPFIFNRKPNGLRLVATCANGELHEIGMRMVADLFEMDGWDTSFIGASTPTPALLSLLKENPPHLLAVSASIAVNVPQVAALIRALRSEPILSGIPVLVGGTPFRQAPALWSKVGADGFAYDGVHAIDAGRRLVGV